LPGNLFLASGDGFQYDFRDLLRRLGACHCASAVLNFRAGGRAFNQFTQQCGNFLRRRIFLFEQPRRTRRFKSPRVIN